MASMGLSALDIISSNGEAATRFQKFARMSAAMTRLDYQAHFRTWVSRQLALEDAAQRGAAVPQAAVHESWEVTGMNAGGVPAEVVGVAPGGSDPWASSWNSIAPLKPAADGSMVDLSLPGAHFGFGGGAGAASRGGGAGPGFTFGGGSVGEGGRGDRGGGPLHTGPAAPGKISGLSPRQQATAWLTALGPSALSLLLVQWAACGSVADKERALSQADGPTRLMVRSELVGVLDTLVQASATAPGAPPPSASSAADLSARQEHNRHLHEQTQLMRATLQMAQRKDQVEVTEALVKSGIRDSPLGASVPVVGAGGNGGLLWLLRRGPEARKTVELTMGGLNEEVITLDVSPLLHNSVALTLEAFRRLFSSDAVVHGLTSIEFGMRISYHTLVALATANFSFPLSAGERSASLADFFSAPDMLDNLSNM